MSRLLLPSCYVGPVELYALLWREREAEVEFCDHYSRQTKRNRCRIISSDGPMDLIIPVEKHEPDTLGRDIRIASYGWQELHWRSIKSSYDGSPYLEYFEDELHPFYFKKYKFLYEYNLDYCRCLAGLFGIEAAIEPSSDYSREPEGDYRRLALKKPGLDCFAEAEYYQVFAPRFGFRSGMGAIDLLCNMGPESVFVFKKMLGIK